MAAPMVIPDTERVRKAVTLINALDTGRFSRLLSRILQKLHIKVGIESENDPKSLNVIWAAFKYMNFSCQNPISSHVGQ
ncbi:PREDICTED: COMM domain-containing protein 10 [Thamnophis sirtalis]|uniref:COMM domain-containing protein 10 n=1 Tax=Thamnophis sirtalis TaxID=35019 RepID=A0A6I9Y4N9_9SAUR|nr:PREDICTED: COMM domain-containing protein 10 [Thamnophis sirtalis]